MDLRKKRQMSMRELAERSGASTSFISQVETGKTNPTVAKLQNLATALGVPVNYFFDPHNDPPPPPPETPPRRVLVGPAGTAGGDGNGMPVHSGVPFELVRNTARASFELDDGVTWERLTPHGRNGIEFLEVTYPVGTGSGPLASHFGEEFVLVLEGALEVRFAFDTVVLEAGDSLVFDSTVPHTVANVGEIPMRAAWVNWTRRHENWSGPQL
jgi:mannose-6-phosphate isomerase-like protein (cupin superfamily)/DNA-binding XRE family transcriptional regulator